MTGLNDAPSDTAEPVTAPALGEDEAGSFTLPRCARFDAKEEKSAFIDRSGEGRLGVKIDDSDGVSLVIMHLGPGLISDWNRENRDSEMAVGDRIVEANGVRGDAAQIYKECTTAATLSIKFLRESAQEAIICPTDNNEVYVHVYDLWGCQYRFPRLLNAGSTRFGLFHTGVEVYGREWYFCGTDEAKHGVYSMPQPKLHPIHRYCKSVYMGRTQLRPCDLEELIPTIREKWPGNTYHPMRRNCHHFTDFFCRMLGFRNAPAFGICGSGDRNLAIDYNQGQSSGFSLCVPCASRMKKWRRGSRPLLEENQDGTQGSPFDPPSSRYSDYPTDAQCCN
mmetsp:Transcript_19147/g.37612  ORF Transcript_19147/g.37612 Transcript_19147/m.37612 type:complete len:336 (+) Transcript_19147:21-1028(+)|eukprot:CAMPEP_0172675380 /NCGR_PEP_ID=MMETSP1074-20121228/13233_1 /TAXON_ID=2916 /ORGANISM="Ceratium fusus, Strain PA161109" /LENGTH=335 /DNA_ID=CAMNT_0013492835 /DNA_START=72 /DNA_END=1079 /DNA_ORIENTATION=+